MFKRLGRLTTAHAWEVCIAWVIIGAALSYWAPTWTSRAQDDDIRFLPARCPSVRGYHLLEQAFPQEIFASRAIFAIERNDGKLTPADFALVDAFTSDLDILRREEPGLQIGKIASYRDGVVGNRLVSADNHCTLIQVALGTPFLAIQTRTTVDRCEAKLQHRLVQAGQTPPRAMTTGPAGLGRDLTNAGAQGLEGTTLATVGLVVIVLLLVYRAPLLALVPLVSIAVSVWVSLNLLALMTLIPGVHLVNISRIFAVVILYGAGTDYCLFLISRYREELSRTFERSVAIRRSVTAVGGALAASAGTVICGLGMMAFAEFAKVRCAGPAIGLSLAVALMASLTLTPALLSILGRGVFWPSRGPVPARPTVMAENETTFWDRVSRGVVARPLLVWSVAVLVLLPLAIVGFQVRPNYKSTGELPPSAGSIKGVAAIQRHFTAGEIGPITVLVVSSTDWNSSQGHELIAHLCRGLANLPNVAEIRSLTQPLGTPLPARTAPLSQGKGLWGGFIKSVRHEIDHVVQKATKAAREFYVAPLTDETGQEYATRLDVVMRTDPFEPESIDTLAQIQTILSEDLPRWTGRLGTLRAECYGVTVNARDLAQVTEMDRSRVNFLVLAGIFVILLVLVRRPWLAAYLLITVLFSYYATMGATVIAGAIWSGRPLTQIEWRVPFFLFTILIAVGEDYNILLITRILQERRKRGLREGIRRALAHTGGTITSCGLIMAGTFATLMLAGLGTLVQIGFALAFGVLLDTFVVRPFLVPTFVLMVWPKEKVRSAAERSVAKPSEISRLAG